MAGTSPANAAAAAIGADDPDADWQLRPDAHAHALPPEAGALARILQSAAVREIIARYTAADARAVAAQAVYKIRSRQAIFARLGAILAGGMFLLPLDSAGAAGGVAMKLGIVVQYACLGLALALTAFLNARKLFARWMGARADAELARLALFDVVMDAKETPRPGELPVLPLKLDYLRRYQLDVQTRYYLGRGDEHKSAAGQTERAILWLNILSFLSFLPLAVVAADVLGLIVVPNASLYLSALALGTAFSGILGALSAISSMNLDERNAARYLVVHENLKDLSGASLARAREAAARGDEAAVRQFTDAVQRLISAEHQEWIVLRNHIKRPEQLVGAALDPVSLGVPADA